VAAVDLGIYFVEMCGFRDSEREKLLFLFFEEALWRGEKSGNCVALSCIGFDGPSPSS
jgi:hypothetical protein